MENLLNRGVTLAIFDTIILKYCDKKRNYNNRNSTNLLYMYEGFSLT